MGHVNNLTVMILSDVIAGIVGQLGTVVCKAAGEIQVVFPHQMVKGCQL